MSKEMDAMAILSELENAYKTRTDNQRCFEIPNPTKEVLTLVREFDGHVKHVTSPTLNASDLVRVWVPKGYCVDLDYVPDGVEVSELFECWDPEDYTHTILRFIYPVGEFPLAVVEFHTPDERTTEVRESRFYIETLQEVADDTT